MIVQNQTGSGGYVKGDVIAADYLEETLGNFSELSAVPGVPQKYTQLYKSLTFDPEDTTTTFVKQYVSVSNPATGATAFAYLDNGDVYVIAPDGSKISEKLGTQNSYSRINASGFRLFYTNLQNLYDVFTHKYTGPHYAENPSAITITQNSVAWYDTSAKKFKWNVLSGTTWSTKTAADNFYTNRKALVFPSHIVSYQSFTTVGSTVGYGVFSRSSGAVVSEGLNKNWGLYTGNLNATNLRVVNFPDQSKFFVYRSDETIDFCSYNPADNSISVIKADIKFFPGVDNLSAVAIGDGTFALLGAYYGFGSSSTTYLVRMDASGNILNVWSTQATGEVEDNALNRDNGHHFLLSTEEDDFKYLSVVDAYVKIAICGKLQYKVLEVVK